jgi:hypothetical protein
MRCGRYEGGCIPSVSVCGVGGVKVVVSLSDPYAVWEALVVVSLPYTCAVWEV